MNATKEDLQISTHVLLRETFRAYLYTSKKKFRWGKFINSSKVTQETLFKFRREYLKATFKTFDLRWNVTE